jgi:hypothetical protein
MKQDKKEYLRLRPSKIEGVGVFTEIEFNEGEEIPVWDDDDMRIIENPSRREQIMCENYCVYWEGKYYCPKNWSRISLGWYLNHSSTPNATIDENDKCVAIRKIGLYEEIVIDYNCLSLHNND